MSVQRYLFPVHSYSINERVEILITGTYLRNRNRKVVRILITSKFLRNKEVLELSITSTISQNQQIGCRHSNYRLISLEYGRLLRFLLPVQFTCIRQVVEILMTCLVSGRLCKFLGHLIPSYELLPWLGVRRRLSCVVRRTQSVNIFSRLRQILSRATKTNGERDERANFNQIGIGGSYVESFTVV